MQVINNPADLAAYQFGLTCEKAIEGKSLSLMKKHEPMAFELCAKVLLAGLLDAISVNQKFSVSLIPMYLQAIFSRYYYLTIDEVAYVFKKGITGEYKKEYNKLDLETLMQWFELYDTTERMQWIEKRNHNQKIEAEKELKETIKANIDPLMVQEIIKSLVGDDSIDKEKQKEKEYQDYKVKVLKEAHAKQKPNVQSSAKTRENPSEGKATNTEGVGKEAEGDRGRENG